MAATNFELCAGASAGEAALLTVVSLGASLTVGAAASAGAGLAGAALTTFAVGAGVALAESFAAESLRAKAAVEKASKTRVIYRLSFDFMCLISFWR